VAARHGSPKGGLVPRLPLALAVPGAVEFISPSASTPDLDKDVDGAPLRFRVMRNILGTTPVPRVTDWAIVEDLLVAIGEELCSAHKALKYEEWHMAMKDELASIEENQTWSLVNLPKGHRNIGLKWFSN
jgi:hypothetical protein